MDDLGIHLTRHCRQQLDGGWHRLRRQDSTQAREMDNEMTVLDVVQTLRGMAACIEVDNGGYQDKLISIADWIENTYAAVLTSKKITFSPPPLPESEMRRRQEEIIKALQHDLALVRKQLAHTQRGEA